MTTATPDQLLSRAIHQAELSVQLTDPAGRAAARELIQLLSGAEASLKQRLERWIADHGGPTGRFTEASLQVYAIQTQATVQYVQQRLAGIVAENAERVALATAERQFNLVRDLEREFTGITIPPRSREAVVARVRPSLLARHATSVDRYGTAMINRTMGVISQGFVEGVTQREMVNRLVALKGPRGLVSMRAVEIQPGMVIRLAEESIPEGLFVRHRDWAWRIVRTEVAEAQNAVSLESIDNDAQRDMPDMRKKIIAVMDNRTGQDSIGVHGQIRGPGEYFRDGAGREYLRPPSRPHDRETLIPWRPHWKESRVTRRPSERERDEMWQRNREWQRNQQRRRARLNANRTEE